MLEAWAVILGLVVGSFLNVLVLRLQKGESLTGRSRCPNCQRQLAWYHNIPVVSFVCLRGRCGFCRQPIAWQYPMVELAAGLLFGLGALKFGSADLLWLFTYFAVVAWSLALFVYDYKYQLLPDSLTLTGAVILGILNWWRGAPVTSLLLGAIVAAGFFAVQFWLSRGRWIGAGDIRLGIFMGLALGWPLTGVALVLAYWLGAAVGISLVLSGRRDFHSALPFGTFLTAATVVTFLWGNGLLDWYFKLLGF
jgi:prepilin signal peptidase PulO-like enzyme (type II secretory pathway)